MSIILEALKKVEKDKSRKRRKKNIAEAILQPHDSGPARSKVLLISCIVFSAAVLLGTGAGITYFLSKAEPVKPAPAATPDVVQTAAVSKPPIAAAEKPAEAAAVASQTRTSGSRSARTGERPRGRGEAACNPGASASARKGDAVPKGTRRGLRPGRNHADEDRRDHLGGRAREAQGAGERFGRKGRRHGGRRSCRTD